MVHTSLRALLDTTHTIATEIVAVDAPDVDREARWPERGMRALQGAGLGGLVVPEPAGGLGQGLFALAQIGEILGRVCPSTALCFGMHTVGAAVIAAKATPEQQQAYLDPINRGTHLTTLTLSEPGTGSHFYFPQTALSVESPTHFRVTGKKSFTTNGGYADSYVVSTVATGPEAPLGEFSCVMVREGTPGMVWGPAWSGLGMRGNSSRSLELRDVLVPRADLLGAEGEQIWYIFNVVAPYFLIAMAGTYLGIAGAALAEAQAHMQQRTYSHSGTGLGHVSVLQHRLGTLWGMVERTRRLVYFAAQEADSGGPDTLPALCTAKAEVADCAVTVVNEVMTLMGGITYRGGSRVERMLRDARAAHVMAPTTDILRTWAGRALLGQPLLGD
jgi:alkylation response protein AidB-like acyl-CoA dehydrogenase